MYRELTWLALICACAAASFLVGGLIIAIFRGEAPCSSNQYRVFSHKGKPSKCTKIYYE